MEKSESTEINGRLVRRAVQGKKPAEEKQNCGKS